MQPEKPLSLRAFLVVLSLGAWGVGLAGASAAAAPPAANPGGRWPVAVKVIQEGRIRIARGKRRQVVDLTRVVAGCTRTRYDSSTHKKFGEPLSVEIADETEQGGFTYLLLLALTPANCNVQGECGAGGDDATLVWLKIDRKLAVAGRQAFAIDDCRAGRDSDVPNVEEPEDTPYLTIEAKDLPWKGDVLRIEYREREEAPRHLVYDRRSPEAGLQFQP
jgi:hypothetical protein